MATTKAMEKMVKARNRLMVTTPFFASIALQLPLIETGDVETMATDGKNMFFNPSFVDSLTFEETIFVQKHEVLHVTNCHHTRRGNRDNKVWNAACDYAVNDILINSGETIVAGGLHNPKFAGKTPESIYQIIYQEEKEKQGKGGGKQPQTGKPEPGTGKGKPGDILDFPGESGKPTEQETQKENQKWEIAAQQAEMFAQKQGNCPAEISRIVKEMKESKIDISDVLMRFVEMSAKNDYSWQRPNKRYLETGFFLPSLFSPDLPPVAIAIDTSGSISQTDLQEFTGILENVLATFNTTLHVIYCDSIVAGTEEFTRDDIPITLNAKGGGGTRFSPVFEHIEKQEERPICLVYLTDLDASDFGKEPDYPVLWIQTKGRKKEAPFGETIRTY